MLSIDFRTILCECLPDILMPDVFSLVILIKKYVAIYFITVHSTLSHVLVNPHQGQNLQIQKEEGGLFKTDDNLTNLSRLEQ